MEHTFRPLAWGSVALVPGELQRRSDLNRAYMLSLTSENLLQNYYMEAGIWGPRLPPAGARARSPHSPILTGRAVCDRPRRRGRR